MNGIVTIAVNAKGCFSAQLRTRNGREAARGVFGVTQRATVLFAKSGLEIELQRYMRFFKPALEGSAVDRVRGYQSLTFTRVLRRAELVSLPTDRAFVGAFRFTVGDRSLAAPTHLRVSSKDRWTLLGSDREGRWFSAATPALSDNQVCFAFFRSGGLWAISRVGMLTYDPAAHRLTGSLHVDDPSVPSQMYTEDGVIGAYIRPALGGLPGVFAGSIPAPARLVVTDQSGAETTQAFS